MTCMRPSCCLDFTLVRSERKEPNEDDCVASFFYERNRFRFGSAADADDAAVCRNRAAAAPPDDFFCV